VTDLPLLEARGIGKTFPGTQALESVDFAIYPGKVHALVGENGAGKSTLVKILAGIETPTTGTLLGSGQPIRLESTRDADRFGIGVIHQELNLLPNLSVAENIFVGHELRRYGVLVDRAAQRCVTRELMARLDHPIPPDTLVGSLPLGRQQLVEIAKALARRVRILMMDEPTSALSAAEVEVLFRVVRELTAAGVAVVYISHRMQELLRLADDVTVLRDGRVVGRAAAGEIDAGWIVERMTGRPAEAHPRENAAGSDNPSVLRAGEIELRAGEIVGLYGLMGAGRTELLEGLIGLRLSQNPVWLDGARIDRLDTAGRIRRGLAMVSEDRQRSGLVATLPLGANITLAALRRLARAGYLSARTEDRAAAAQIADLGIRAAGPRVPITALSGGNQQKAVIARCLLTSPKVLLMDQPTRGIDVGAKEEIYRLMRRLATQGMAILFATSEIAEVRAVADRILVLTRGRIAAAVTAAQATDEALVTAAGGGAV
jgi:erythritol transport system ATP-binding protein